MLGLSVRKTLHQTLPFVVTRSVRQADDDFAIEARAFAKLQEIIGPGAFDHGSRADRASGRDQEGEERSNMRSHDLS